MTGKRIRQRGKVKLSEYFKKIEDGARVSVITEASFPAAFPKRILGRTGVVSGSRGRYKIVEVNDGEKAKTFIIHPIHLKRLEGSKDKK
jgi:large subunit ribosomal protein L21e